MKVEFRYSIPSQSYGSMSEISGNAASHLGVMIKVVILKVLYLVVKENVLHLAQSISKCALFQSLTDEFSSAFRGMQNN